jgi:hypothetical protein
MFFFGYLLRKYNPLGWRGTIAVSLFVIVTDTLTIFNLADFLGISKIAAFGEIPFSILIICYLIQSHVRSRAQFTKYNISTKCESFFIRY